MVNNNYTTAAALELVQFVGGMISNLVGFISECSIICFLLQGFVLATCLNVGFEASAKAEAFRFAASVNKVSNYLANHLFDLEVMHSCARFNSVFLPEQILPGHRIPRLRHRHRRSKLS